MNTPEREREFAKLVRETDPLVSVIVPSYMKGPFLSETLDSILEQSYPRIEIHVVNDGSTDATSEITRSFQARAPDRSITLHEGTNRGVSAARNTGLAAARGRVVMTVDGDDQLTPHYVATAVQAMRVQEASLFFAAQQNFGEQDSVWRPKPYDRYYLRYENSIPTPAVFDRTLWELCGGFKVSLGYAEDWEFWVNCSRFEPRVAQSEELLTRYRVNSQGIARTYIDGNWRDCACVVIIANEDLYAVSEVLEAHNRFPESAPQSLNRIESLDRIHPDQWISKLLLGMLAERRGDRQSSLSLYLQAIERSGATNWQPLFRRGVLLDALGEERQALEHLHLARTIRPDLGPLVKQRLAIK